jgi:hypothetical protein
MSLYVSVLRTLVGARPVSHLTVILSIRLPPPSPTIFYPQLGIQARDAEQT